ncbi:mechanosensitive ion channel family protein [Alloprevotella sp. OH1205_COT-284]|nr:mechanosensitive ion channel family protein [Alloprevotella sp. OH1205_COT-284]
MLLCLYSRHKSFYIFNMIYIRQLIESFLSEHFRLSAAGQIGITSFLLVFSLVLISFAVVLLFLRLIVPLIRWGTKRTTNLIDDILLNPKVLTAFGWCIPFFIFDAHISDCFPSASPRMLLRGIHIIVNIYGLIAIILFIAEVINIAHLFLSESKRYKDYHLGGIFQAFKIIIYCVGGIILIAMLIGQSPLNILTGLGASAAIIMLVFKDPILGFLASIQLTSNRMLKKEDWVAIEKMGINGKVEEVSLTTVKIRNFDNSISTVPPYTLVSDSFQNWSEMQQIGARRVKRSLYIDIHSIQPCTDENGNDTTNLSLFRRHVEKMIDDNPLVIKELNHLVRQLAPTPHGLPIEVWFYLSETDFQVYENLAAEFMERLIASLPLFNLRCYQALSSFDVMQQK